MMCVCLRYMAIENIKLNFNTFNGHMKIKLITHNYEFKVLAHMEQKRGVSPSPPHPSIWRSTWIFLPWSLCLCSNVVSLVILIYLSVFLSSPPSFLFFFPFPFFPPFSPISLSLFSFWHAPFSDRGGGVGGLSKPQIKAPEYMYYSLLIPKWKTKFEEDISTKLFWSEKHVGGDSSLIELLFHGTSFHRIFM